jgi:hypothetical protein
LAEKRNAVFWVDRGGQGSRLDFHCTLFSAIFSRIKVNAVKEPALFAVRSGMLVSEGLFPRNQEPEA